MSGIDAGSAYLTILPKPSADFAAKLGSGVAPALDKASKQAADQMAKNLEAGGKQAGDGLSKGLLGGASSALKSLKSLGDESKSLGEKLSTVGSTLTKSLTPAAGAVAASTGLIASSWRSMSKEIAVQTGATGDRLKDLTDSVRNVAGTVKGSIGEIGDVVSDLAAKTKLTGKPLEDLTRKILSLKELGIGVSGSQVAATLGAWGVAADKMGDALDRMFRIAQTTGQPMSTLIDRLTEFRPILQSMGIGFDQATLLVSRLTDAMVPGLRKALGDIAKAGGDPKTAFDQLVGSIKNAATEQEALQLGVEAFGTKSAPALVGAIRAGKFELDALAKAVDANGNSIEATAEKYRSWGDKLAMVKDKVAAFVGPFAQQAATFATVATGIGPVVEGLGKLSQKAEGGSRGAQLLIGGLKGLGVALGAASVGFAVYQVGSAAAERSIDSMHRKLASLGDADLQRSLQGMPRFMVEFNKLAAENAPAAARVASAYKAAGGETSGWEKKLRDVNAAQAEASRQAQIQAEALRTGVTPAQAEFNLSLKESADKLKDYDDALRNVFSSHTGLLSSQLAVANAEADLEKAIADGTLELNHNTEAGRRGTAMFTSLMQAIDGEVEAARADAEAHHQAFDRKSALIALLQREQDKYPALRDQIQQYIDSLNSIPDDIDTNVTVNVIRYTTDYGRSGAGLAGGLTADQHEGGIMEFYAGGGLRRENHIAQIAPRGVTRIWNEPETDGESYIPLAMSKRMRSKAVLAETARRMGGDVTWHADGSYSGGMTTTADRWTVDYDRLAAALARALNGMAVVYDRRMVGEMVSDALGERGRAR